MGNFNDFVLVKDLAEKLGMDRSNALKMVKVLKIETFSVRSAETKMQSASAVSPEDAEFIINLRTKQGFGADGKVDESSFGSYLYVVRPDPEARPDRIKVGKAADVNNRTADYRTICPDVSTLRSWSAPSQCEGYLIALADTLGKRVGVELFDMSDNLEKFLESADAAFSCFEVS